MDAYTRLECDEASDNAGEICFFDDDCVGGACASAGVDPGICLGTDAEAAASILTIGDPCQDLTLSFGDYVTCALENSSTDQDPFLCAP